jgi:flavin reductase (DIM6/NTAB) family NADH-FMN oxidoreductase RutF
MVIDPPIVAFSCSLSHHTAQNILEQHEFVVNIPGQDILEQTLETAKDYPKGVNELEKAGLAAIPSIVVSPPRIAECLAHLECTKEWHKTYGDEIVLFGRGVAISLDGDFFNASCEERYRMIQPIFPLGERRFATLGKVRVIPR